MNVSFGVDLSKVDDWFSSPEMEELAVAKGKYPKNGRDGYVKFLVDISAKPQFIPEPENGGKGVDFHRAMRVPLVDTGQKIAEIIPPTNGEPGTNVLGGSMAAAAGNGSRIGMGDGVEQKGNDIFAKSPGIPSYRDNIVNVRRTFEVSGDVSFATGNINFPGTVIVKGDVLDDFEIVAQEHVVVQGLVNAAKITAGGYVQCLGGIFGKGKAEIRANGFIEARFADSCTLSSDADVTVSKDILHCKVMSLGMVKCAGAILGGEVTALKGVEATEIGSEAGSKTLVFIRKHYRQEKAKEMVAGLLTEANGILENYKRWLQAQQMGQEDLEQLEKAIRQVSAIIQKKSTLESQIDKFERLLGENKGALIRIGKMLWADTVLGAPYCKFSPLEKSAGPLTIVEDVSHGTMMIQHGGAA